jgi:hypothetical protein
VLEVALEQHGEWTLDFDAEQNLLLCNKVHRQINSLPERTRRGTPLAAIVRHETERD